MSFLVSPFSRPSRAHNAWFCAGPASSYPNLDDTVRVGERRSCGANFVPGCRVFHVPQDDSSNATEVAIDDWKDPELGGNSKDQVMVFQYRGKFVAVNHECPHSSYPLSNGVPFDIEDFGVVLSSGIQCPKHDWSFDLHTGRSDRGSYKLQVWEVQQQAGAEGNEIWVRRKQRIG
ncbi:hypothetical protein ACJQWK_00920 [Exserohilum turcicum]|uniref:Rieske domain-containing protein n=1 Tax=Exserohilum turcicum (strain 28A) TaxID=671987 RepID=R0IGJ2_EXST2|nr:uncharacterized protein SETTUDRAFT_139341 [Exserohilum turcica Et28A]EOA84370.1 hypothetical protein SETTUDRAFT_139341 [Exserohilum turcica Et28A]